jgi:hypothetical protein
MRVRLTLSVVLIALIGVAIATASHATKLFGGESHRDRVLAELNYVADKFNYVHARDEALAERPASFSLLAAIRHPDVSCGWVALWAKQYLARRGVSARRVAVWTRKQQTGHTMLEVRIDGNWMLVDTLHDAYLTSKGKPLSLLEVVQAVRGGIPYQVHRLGHDNDFFIDGNLHHYYRSEANLALIEWASRYFFGDRTQRRAAERYARVKLHNASYYQFDSHFVRDFYGSDDA